MNGLHEKLHVVPFVPSIELRAGSELLSKCERDFFSEN
jgi:hypothetical protein